MNQTIVSIPSASSIEVEYRALGFTEGPPSHIPIEYVQSDVRIYARLKCAACKHRGHKVTPWHRRRDYRLLAACRNCGAGIEC
ncbi:MAG TPA: hypothetical protein VN688_33400 [Gemmataceae bacterium]|nr:hypothetical protein [Gemmataceae bacterium]